MAENDISIVIIDDNETQPSTGEVIDLDKYSTEEGEIEDERCISPKKSLESPKREQLEPNQTVILLSPEPVNANVSTSTVPIKPTFEVIFRDRNEYDKLGDSVLKALKQCETLGEPKFEYVSKDGSIQAFGLETIIEDKTTQSDENSNDSIDFGADLNKLFTIDATPSEKLEITDVPSYKRHSRDVLDIESKPKQVKKDDNACPRPRPAAACFNCGKYEHSIRDCPKPRNPERIARAKRAHAAKGERYHVDVDQRFAHIQPGQISDKLRKALGMRRNELPTFFYRMRSLGYPPGWLEEAKVSHSGLAMFNTNDDVLKSEENSNECEIKYDISKIIEFPGFNVMPEGYRDDYKFNNVSPYSENFSKERMIAALGDAAIKGFKRKKLKDHTETSTTATQVEVIPLSLQDKDQNEEMEIDDEIVEENVEFTRPLPPQTPPTGETPPPPLPPAETDETIEDGEITEIRAETIESNNHSVSPTLEELQAKQRDLILKLTNGVDELQNDTSLPSTPGTPSTPTTATSTNSSSSIGKTTQYIIKTSHIGTPVLKFSPFDKIPATDNFKVGVSDVINFENLPDSTGKYEAMKEVISKVRMVKKQLAKEDD